MSGEEEDFLARWSRRKRAAAEPAASTPPAPEAGQRQSGTAAPNNNDKTKPAAEFDLTSLPPIESITSVTDVTAFLRAGVPLELTRAALRRAWSADPSIREFIGLSENSWDFTKPNEIAGFGPLDATHDVRQLLAEIIGKPSCAAESADAGKSVEEPQALVQAQVSGNDSKVIAPPAIRDDSAQEAKLPQDQEKKLSAAAADRGALAPDGKVYGAMQNQSSDTEPEKQLLHRTHGGALPQ